MSDGLQRYLELASEVTRTTIGTTERLLAQFVRQGEVAAEAAERVLDELVTRSVEGSEAVSHLVRAEVERAVERAGFVRIEEVDELRRQIDLLRSQLAGRNGDLHDDAADTGI